MKGKYKNMIKESNLKRQIATKILDNYNENDSNDYLKCAYYNNHEAYLFKILYPTAWINAEKWLNEADENERKI
mgnify:FL=1